MAKKFVRVFGPMLQKNPNKICGQPNTLKSQNGKAVEFILCTVKLSYSVLVLLLGISILLQPVKLSTTGYYLNNNKYGLLIAQDLVTRILKSVHYFFTQEEREAQSS